MKERLAWLSTVPLMFGGLLAGHALSYRLAIPDAHARADALARSGHSYFGYAPLALAVCFGLLLSALLFRAFAGYRGHPGRPAASRAFVLLPPLGFLAQEHVELVYSGHLHWTTMLQPTVLLGLLLQLPFALAALVIAWVLDSAAHALGRALAAMPSRTFPASFVSALVRVSAAPRPTGLARGYGERAPPLLRRT